MSKSDTPKETCETCYGLGRVDAVYAPCPDCELTAARELVKNLEITVLSLMMENKTVTEQRDRLAEALWNMLNQEHGSAIKAGILLRSLNLQYLNPNTKDQERKSPASDGSNFNNPNEP